MGVAGVAGEGGNPRSSRWSRGAWRWGRRGGVKRNLALAVGSVGVVYGDIGTSPLYALKESLHHAAEDGLTRLEVIGIVSLLIWAVVVVVTLKYVVFIMRADNKGEGGTLSLMALAQKAVGRRSLRSSCSA